MERWDDIERFLLDEATEDLRHGQDIRPCLVAFAGDQPLLLGFLRPFPKGDYADPITELIALAAPLGADRLALSMGARAWSLIDPIPPVVPGVGDLRQRVLVIERADGSRGAARGASSAHPYDLNNKNQVTWGTPIRQPGNDGWISRALTVSIDHRQHISGSVAETRRQADRCVRLGHTVALAPAVWDRLGRPAPAP